MSSPQYLPGTDQVLDLFKGEIPRAGGRVTDAYEDGRRLFLRSVFPEVEEVRPRDKMQGGLAVHVAGPRIAVHLYLFRQVCRNGAIMAHSVQTQEIERVSPLECFQGTVLLARVVVDDLAGLRMVVASVWARTVPCGGGTSPFRS